MRYYLQTKKTTLSYSISDSETTIRLSALLKLDGTSVSAADIGDYMTFTIDPGTSKEEICSIASSGVTVNADGTVDITGVVRGLREGGTGGYSTGGYSAEHGAGAVVVFSNNPQLYNQLANKSNDNTFTGLNIFSGYAPQTDTDPVAANDLTRLSYVQALVLGTLTTIDVVVPGTAGETIADGNLIYLNTDNKWYKTDADTTSTVNNVLLGIAKGAGTANNPITNGILLQGVDNAQSGLVAGEIQYASNTAGGISSTPGTTEVTVGVAKSTTELYFSPRFNQQITEDQQDALAGTSGTPGASNKFVTADDVSNAAASGKIVRATGTALPALSGENLIKIQSLERFAGYTAASNTSENTVFTTTLAGGLLSTTGMIRITIPIVGAPDNNGSGNETYTLRLKYGGSTIQTSTISSIKGNGTGSYSGFVEFWIINNAATNSQNVGSYFSLSLAGSINSVGGVYMSAIHATDTTSAIDTTSSQTLALTVQRADGTNSSLAFRQGIIETIYK